MSYDSKNDTLKHITRVRHYIDLVQTELWLRATTHDQSKLYPPEKRLFDLYTPKLKYVTFGSVRYREYLIELTKALDHHYSHNRHHPQFFSNGIMGMNLVDLIEMICDWKAAAERHADGDISKSLDINAGRFNIPPSIVKVLANTVEDIL